MTLLIYREQLRSDYINTPYTYVPHDVTYSGPFAMGEEEPPLETLYPIIDKEGHVDPLTFRIGYTISGKPFALNPRYIVNPLVFIVGTPGAGKSATVKTLVHSILQNHYLAEEPGQVPPVIIVDKEGEYSVLRHLVSPSDMLVIRLGRGDYVNVYGRPSYSISPFLWYTRMTRVLARFLGVHHEKAPVAYKVLKEIVLKLAKDRKFTNDPRTWLQPDIHLGMVYETAESMRRAYEQKSKLTGIERRRYEALVTLTNRLDEWSIPPHDVFFRESSFPIHELLKYKLVIFDVREVDKDVFNVFTYWIVEWFYGYMLIKGPLPQFGLRVVLVLDEAWALVSKQNQKETSPLEELARRGRKYGIMIVVATQTPEDVDEKMFSLFGTLATGVLPSEAMRRKIARARGMPEGFEEKIATLPRGTLVWSINWAMRNFEMHAMPLIVRTAYPIRELLQVE